MSCQIKGIANLTNTSNIKELLFGDSTRRRELLYSFVLSPKGIVNVSVNIFQMTFHKMNYHYKTVLYHYHQLEMFLLWQIIQR